MHITLSRTAAPSKVSWIPSSKVVRYVILSILRTYWPPSSSPPITVSSFQRSFTVSRESRRTEKVVVTAITTIYVLYILDWIIQCYWRHQSMVANGGTWESIFVTWVLVGPPPALFAFDDFVYFSGFAVSDALLVSYIHCNGIHIFLNSMQFLLKIWRCYHVLGKSLRVILVPLAFLLIDVGESLLHKQITVRFISGLRRHCANSGLSSPLLSSFPCSVSYPTIPGSHS